MNGPVGIPGIPGKYQQTSQSSANSYELPYFSIPQTETDYFWKRQLYNSMMELRKSDGRDIVRKLLPQGLNLIKERGYDIKWKYFE